MILDAENTFSKEQAVTATAASTTILDLGPGDHGPSERISLVVQADGFTAGALSVELKTSDALSSGALSSPVTVATFPITATQLAAGGLVVAARLPHALKRYVALNYNVGTTCAGGTFTAGLALDVQQAETIIKP